METQASHINAGAGGVSDQDRTASQRKHFGHPPPVCWTGSGKGLGVLLRAERDSLPSENRTHRRNRSAHNLPAEGAGDVPVCLISVLLTGIPESEDAEVSTGKQVLWLLSGASDACCSSVHEGPKTTVFALQEPAPQWNLSSSGDQYSFPVSCCLPSQSISKPF